MKSIVVESVESVRLAIVVLCNLAFFHVIVLLRMSIGSSSNWHGRRVVEAGGGCGVCLALLFVQGRRLLRRVPTAPLLALFLRRLLDQRVVH